MSRLRVRGKLYPQNEPAKLVHITGMAPLAARVYSCDRLRCNLCGEVFTAKSLAPAHEEPLNQAAQATVLYNDDTTMKVLQLTRKQRAAALADDADGELTGVFTSGIVVTHAGQQIALFFTGVRHPGENLAAVRFVLETLREVYVIDARAREQRLDPAQRLALPGRERGAHEGARAVDAAAI